MLYGYPAPVSRFCLVPGPLEIWETYVHLASLQIPFLLNTTLAASTYISAFPFVPESTFGLLQKLDLAFSYLLCGGDDTGHFLPIVESARKVTLTEKVRLRGIVERIRLQVVLKAEQDDGNGEGSQTMTTDDESCDDAMEVKGCVPGNHTWEIEIARVFEKTIVALSTSLDGSLGGCPES